MGERGLPEGMEQAARMLPIRRSGCSPVSGCAGAICIKINCNGRGYPRRRKPPQRMHPPGRTRSAQQRASRRRAPGVPIANEDRLVVPDVLATAIKSASSVAREVPARLVSMRYGQRSRYWSPRYRACRRDVPRDLLRPSHVSGQRTGSFWLQLAGAGSRATHCERGRGPITLAGAPSDALMFVKGSDYSVIRFLWSQGE